MSGPRILVVDDNPELLTLLSSSFEEAGYTVATAARGRSALEQTRKDRPDLVILDVLLPDVMGFDVAEALRGLTDGRGPDAVVDAVEIATDGAVRSGHGAAVPARAAAAASWIVWSDDFGVWSG